MNERPFHNLSVPAIEWSWDQAGYLADWHEPIVELLSRYIDRETKILEVGAGGSHTLSALAGRRACIGIGVEPDVAGIRKTLQLAEQESGQIHMVRGDGFFLPFSDREFDVVYSLGLVEHFEPDQSDALIAEHARVCKPGGKVIVAVPNLLNFPHTLRKAWLQNAYQFAPERSLTPRALRKAMTAAGFRSLRLDGLNPLWGLGLSPTGWRVVSLFRRIGLAGWLNRIRSPYWRSRLGFMTYAIGEKPEV